DDPRLRDPLEQPRFRLSGLRRARAAPRRAERGRSREVRVAATPALRERGVRLEPGANARDQRQPRVRRGLPGLPADRVKTRRRRKKKRRSAEATCASPYWTANVGLTRVTSASGRRRRTTTTSIR